MVNQYARSCAWRLALASALLLPACAVPAADLADASAVDIALLRGPGLQGAGTELYLEVRLNGVATRRVMEFVVTADEHHHAWPPNLADVGLRLDGLPTDRYLDLAEIPGLRYRVDMLNQRIDLDASTERLDVATQRLNIEPDPIRHASEAGGALLNYDFYGTAGSGGSRAANALTELRAFGGWGVLSNTGLSNFRESGPDQAYVRLDTVWSRSFQDRLLTVNLGDLISGGLGWTRPTRLGGLQLRRNFGLQPGLITYPIPAFFGEAALPSSVELYVNGIRQYRGEVAPGPFQLYTVPTVNGAGQARVVVTDALGRSRTLNFAFYAADQLLKAGLSDWSAELGVLRRDYGLESFGYGGEPVASGSLRYGASDWLTLEGHAEAGGELYLGGLGTALRLGKAGVIAASAAYSGGEAAGSQAGLSYNWQYRGFNIDIGTLRSFDNYRDVASLDSRRPSLRSDRVVSGLALGAAGSVALSYTRLDTREEGSQRFAGLGYNVNLMHRLSLYANATRNLDDADDTLVFAGLSWSFSRGIFASTSVQHNAGGNIFGADLVRGISPDGGTGWSLRTQQGAQLEGYQAEAGYRGDWGQVIGGGVALNGNETAYASAAGGLVLMDRSVFITRRVDDAFALVSTHGVAEVPVLLENRVIGRTDAQGHYLLTGLNAWQANRISIDVLGLPAQMQVVSVKGEAVPADRAGVKLEFLLQDAHAALLLLQDAQGQPLPLGSRVYGAGRERAMVGYDGQAYVEGLEGRQWLSVVTPEGGSCELEFYYAPAGEGIPVIGPLPCHPAGGR